MFEVPHTAISHFFEVLPPRVVLKLYRARCMENRPQGLGQAPDNAGRRLKITDI